MSTSAASRTWSNSSTCRRQRRLAIRFLLGAPLLLLVVFLFWPSQSPRRVMPFDGASRASTPGLVQANGGSVALVQPAIGPPAGNAPRTPPLEDSPQSPRSPKSAPAAEQPSDGARYLGPARCADCHRLERDEAHLVRRKDFVLLDEGLIVLQQDKHAQAYEQLFTPRGRRMFAMLGIEIDGETRRFRDEANLRKARVCLSCHANWHKSEPAPPPIYELGVTCESCHGPSSEYDAPHSEPAWRTKTPAEKRQLGMIDVRNPLRRAEQCFSCHIGNAEQGKIVTHEMYAAGHPPLPGIEIASFAHQMPVHWRSLPEKGHFVHRDEYIQANFPGLEHDPTRDLPRTKAVIIGGVLALRESIELMAAQAANESARWPELAVFDCFACHHELKSPSWRKARGYKGRVPGRPTMTEWPTALVKLGIRQIHGNDEAAYQKHLAQLNSELERFNETFNARPFGDRGQVQAAGGHIVHHLNRLGEELADSRYDAAAAERALQTLLTLDDSEYPDFHSARQIAWAVRTIYTEWKAGSPNLELFPDRSGNETRQQRTERDAQEIEVLEHWKATAFAKSRAEANDALKEIGLLESLHLKLPAGQEDQIEEALSEWLNRASAYDAQEFRNELRKLGTRLDQ